MPLERYGGHGNQAHRQVVLDRSVYPQVKTKKRNRGVRRYHDIVRTDEYVAMLRDLRERRREKNKETRHHNTRRRLTADQRQEIIQKTDGRCHVCGGVIEGDWHADHVLPHSAGGAHDVGNYLPACSLCNNYRWNYLPEEFQHALKLGIWIRNEIEKGTPLGNDAVEKFMKYEASRLRRRKPPTNKS